MPSINERQHFTVMVEWDVRPEHQRPFVHAVADAVAEHFPSGRGSSRRASTPAMAGGAS